MLFQNPAFLWGMLAVVVPIALHFWHQQRAKPLPWAMLRWLQTPNQPPKRGLHFDELWLFLLRCVLLIVLALLLARPTLPPAQHVPQKAVHLVVPDVAAAFRFELEQARQRGEPIYWATNVPTPTIDLAAPPNAPLNPLTVQAAVNQLQTTQARLHLYVQNTPVWADAPPVSMPPGFVLHTLPAPANQPATNTVLPLLAGKVLAVAETGRWVVRPAQRAGQQRVGSVPLRVAIQLRNPDERRAVRAALSALQETYQLPFLVDKNLTAPPNWLITDRPATLTAPGTFITTTAPPTRPDLPGVTYLPGLLTGSSSDLLTTGQLPERLGTLLAEWLGLREGRAALPGLAFAALFGSAPAGQWAATATAETTAHPRNTLQIGLLVLCLSLLLLERWWATRW
jgi:hypothetical protein